jgi:hypothetical protein
MRNTANSLKPGENPILFALSRLMQQGVSGLTPPRLFFAVATPMCWSRRFQLQIACASPEIGLATIAGMTTSCRAKVLSAGATLAKDDALRVAPILSDAREEFPSLFAPALEQIKPHRNGRCMGQGCRRRRGSSACPRADQRSV